jgi:predicted aspartyl protease
MTPEAVRLWAQGPQLSVHVGDPATPDDGPRSPQSATLLVDTGADLTILRRPLIDALGVPPVGEARIVGVVGGVRAHCPLYLVRLTLEPSGVAFELEVGAVPRDDTANDGLLGRDVLAHLQFSYDGPRGSFVLEASQQ